MDFFHTTRKDSASFLLPDGSTSFTYFQGQHSEVALMRLKETSLSMEALLLLLMVVLDTHHVEASDPCTDYTVLDDNWRATTNLDTSAPRCDWQLAHMSWQGWYRMVHQGLSLRMPETCVPPHRCGTRGPLWLNGPHPLPEDGIVTREVCGSWNGNCCSKRVPSIRVKACPGDYIVYELVSPPNCFGYCTVGLDTHQVEASDPCTNYNVRDDNWRATTNLDTSAPRCDWQLAHMSWQGWYRMVHQGLSLRMPETCVPPHRCGTNGPLWLNGAHPLPEDGIVTREVCGSWNGNCCDIRLPSIRVKACPGDYIVYELVSPPNCYGYCTETKIFQQRMKLKMVLEREPSPAEIAQFTLQIREKLIQMGYPNDTTVRMV
ncbi:uncharacterized protein LOC134077634 [Sardina pilchardus]|uniref:uncharacterized protein LOC134077634 n=1 Tax=Sardina pilchardus TaxID=27697 RepID=UPI002E11BEFD